MGLLPAISARAAAHPDKLLFSFLDIHGEPTESYTYAEFLQRVADVARHIQRVAEPAPGTRVLLVYPPGLEMIAGLLACTSLGLIPVPVYPPSKQDLSASIDRMAFVAQDCGARLLLTTRACSWLISWALVRQKLRRRSLRSTVIDQLQRILGDEAPALGASLRLVPPTGEHAEVLFLQYTSGSTRDPKGVRVTHEGLLANYRSTVDHEPVCVSWLPQYHDLGLIGYYLFIALHGGTTYGFSPFDFIHRPALWLETLSRYGATATAGPNFAFAYCLRPDKVPDSVLEGLDLSRLDYLATAAEPVHAETFRRFRARFARCGLKPSSVFSSYGLAEYTLVVSQYGRSIHAFDREALGRGRLRRLSAEDPSPSKELVSCGRPLACTRVEIVATEGAPRRCASDEVGEIWLHGPSVGAGYWGRPELSAQVFEARLPETGELPWLRTGDLGFLHEGELYISGRLKDLIILRGRNYYPQDIEGVVESDPGLRRGCSAAFSVERDGGEALVVVAEVKHPKRLPDLQRLNQRLLTEAGVGAATWVLIRPRSIAKTSSGKIRRHRVRSDFLEQRLAVVERAESSTPATDSGDPSHPLHPLFQHYGLTGTEARTLTEAGLDSLQLASFADDLQRGCEALGLSLSSDVVDLRLLQSIRVADLFELLALALEASPAALRRSRALLMGLERERLEIETRLMLEDSSATAWPLPAASEGGGIFLTGGTGFLGPFLVHNLLEQTEDSLTVLVRGEDAAAARRRQLDALAASGLDLSRPQRARLHVVCGDLAKPRMGLSAQDWERLACETHTIVHNGALVNYLYNYEAMREANVLGTREVLRLATAVRLKVFNHISSTFVFGWSKQDTLHEQDTNEDLDLLDFGYSQTKWVSEEIVQGALRAGVPGRIFRPALISPTGACSGAAADISIRLLAFMLQHGLGTSAPNQVSFTPVDQVARNIVAITRDRASLGQTLHVTRDDYASLAQVTDILGRLSGRPIELLGLHDFVDAVIERCTKQDPLFPLLNFFVRSTEKISAMSFKRYGNSQYRAARARVGCGADPSLEMVVGGLYAFMQTSGLAPTQSKDTRGASEPEEATMAKQVPQVPRLRALMDSGAMIRNPLEVFERYRADFGATFAFHFGGAKKAIVSADPAFIEHVLRDARNYHKSEIQIERMGEFQGQGLLNSHDEAWLRQRRHLGQGFQQQRLAQLLPMQRETVEQLLDELGRIAHEGPVDVYEQMVRFTLSLVGRSLYGHQLSDEALTQLGTAISEIQAFIVRQVVQPYKIPWFRLSGQSAHFQRLRQAGDQIIRDHIATRKPGEGEDLLAMMLDTPYKDTGETMSREQVLVESMQLMVAGNETSSVALSWTLYLLAQNPEYIGQMRAEIREVLGDAAPDLASLRELHLMQRVVDEALRLYPSFWMFDRKALIDAEIEGFHIPAGSLLSIFVYGVHRNSEFWEDPEVFDPSRFEKARRAGRPTYAHIPFGGGPRKCIGQNLALIQILLVLVGIIRRFDFTLASPEEVRIKAMFITRPDGPIHLQFTPAELT